MSDGQSGDQGIVRNANAQQALAIAIEQDRAGRYDEAKEICKRLLETDPLLIGALGLLGSILRREGDTKAALQLFRRALNVKGDAVPVLGNLGDIYKSIGRYPEALTCYERIVQIEPANVLGHFNLGMVYLVLARFEDAIESYRRALQANPKLPAIHSNIGMALFELGRVAEARASFEQALKIDPKLATVHYNLHATVFDETDLSPALSALKAALAADPEYHEARAYLGMLLDLTGSEAEAGEHFSYIEQKARSALDKVESWRYVRSRLGPGVRLFSMTRAALEYSFSQARLDGLILEFGVRTGVSVNMLARLTEEDIHGFDSFEGLPEAWEAMSAGALSTFDRLPEVPDNVHLHVGWFNDTLPEFVRKHSGPVRFINVDCDIYSSTKTIFQYIGDRIVPGTVIIFDEYICNPGWRENEYRAFQEFVAETGLRYEYLLFSPFSKQAAVIVTA